MIDRSEIPVGDDDERVPANDLPTDLLGKWQTIVDTMAEVVNVPAGLIMRLNGDDIEVCVSSRSRGNVYHVGEREHFANSGLYCERVVTSGRRLMVVDAIASPAWRTNPDVPRGMIAYLGFPIRWPDLSPFGTICVLDDRANAFSPLYERLVEQFRDVIEHHLMLIAQSSDQQRTLDLKREELAAALACSEARLRDASTELARLQRQFTLGQFASAVVHEMNQPLSAAQSSLDAAYRWLDRPEPDVSAALTAIARAAEVGRRAQETMAGLRAMAKPQVAEPVDLNLHEVVREVAFMAHEDAIHARVDVRLDLAADAQWIKGDRSQLHLALHNLMRNAIDAMATVTDRRRELRIATLPAEDGGVDIFVEDTGTGFDTETAARMFRSSFSTKIRGMGMGLMICRAVVEGHGGSIRAESRPDGQGGRFILSLPGPADLALA